jgi:uncharacterized protein with HEPN domain
MTSHDDSVYLQHIIDSIAMVGKFTHGVLETFHTLPEKWYATLRALQILSESAVKLSTPSKEAMSSIDWNRIRGFRNILVHDYLGDIDDKIVRKVIEIELPKLDKAARERLKELG